MVTLNCLLASSIDGNRDLDCQSGSCKKKNLIPVVASVAGLAIFIVVLAVLFYLKRSMSTEDTEFAAHQHIPTERSFVRKETRFTYAEILQITNNFERVLGKGGFGMVYHGYLNDNTQVAVKALSEASGQGYKQFRAEVEHLLRVHHRNLVSLIGYCEGGEKLALVYEYMENGDLKEHLSGKRGRGVLNWGKRLRAATEAAQGLEYLHHGCKPPIIHRDVKTSNILLNEHFQAKLADFGLSRILPAEGESHVSTDVAGTVGYLDPEYYRTNWLTEKNNVYGFGVALLEIITNRKVIDHDRERPHITEWVGMELTKGDIKNIMDPKLGEEYDTNSVWRAVEVAMWCVHPSSSERPDMAHVAIELKECLVAETARTGRGCQMDPKNWLELNLSSETDMFPRAR